MSAKVESALILSIFFLVVSVTSHESFDFQNAFDQYGNGDDDDSNCPSTNFPPELGGKCHVSDFCSKITCEARVQDKEVRITFQVNRCQRPLTATVRIQQGSSLDWSHTFKDGDVIELPVHNKELSQIGKFSVSLKVHLKKEGKKVHFKLELMGDVNVSFLHSLSRKFDTTLLDGEMPLNSKYCGFSAWFDKQPQYVKMLTIAGPILVLIFFILLAACGCCKCCRRRAPTRLQVNLPSHRIQISSGKSKVPIQRLFNEG